MPWSGCTEFRLMLAWITLEPYLISLYIFVGTVQFSPSLGWSMFASQSPGPWCSTSWTPSIKGLLMYSRHSACANNRISHRLYTVFCDVLVMTCFQRYTSTTSIDTHNAGLRLFPPDYQAVVVVTTVVRLWSLREAVTPRLDTTRRPPSSSRARDGGGVPTTTPAMRIRSQTGAQLLVVPCSALCLGTWQLSYQGAVEDRLFGFKRTLKKRASVESWVFFVAVAIQPKLRLWDYGSVMNEGEP